MSTDTELLIEKSLHLIAEYKRTDKGSQAAIRSSRELIAALLHAASTRKSKDPRTLSNQ
jgi:hypothetical protein